MSDIGVSPITPAQGSFPLNTSQTFEPSKPTLPPILPRLLEIHNSLGKIGDNVADDILHRLKREHEEIKLWSKEEVDHLQKLANRSWAEYAWSYMECIANVFAGLYVAYSGLQPGAANQILIVTGVFQTLQAFFNQLGMWDWISKALAEKNEAWQQRLKAVLPFILFAFNFALSLYGLKISSTTHQGLLDQLDKLLLYISGTAKLGSIYTTFKKNNADARLVEIQGQLKYHTQNVDLLSRLLEFAIQQTRTVKSTIKRPFYSLMQATTLASQKA